MEFTDYRQYYKEKGYLPEVITWNRLPEYISGIVATESFIGDVKLSGSNLVFTGIGDAFNTSVDLSSLLGGGGGVAPTGLEAIDEGNGIGWRLVGRDPLNYVAIGRNSVDLSYSDGSNGTCGVSGSYSGAIGENNKVTQDYSFTAGTHNEVGYASFAFGQELKANTYGFAVGKYSEAYGSNSTVIGSNLYAASGYEAVLGRHNTEYSAASGSLWSIEDRLFTIGNGTSESAKSDALIVLKKGTITAPSLTTALIDAETTGKALITKEWFNANNSGGGGGGTTYLGYNETGSPTAGNLISIVGDPTGFQWKIDTNAELITTNAAMVSSKSIEAILLSLKQGSSSYKSDILPPTGLTEDKTFTLPMSAATQNIMPVTVNGVAADGTGNITIPTGSGSSYPATLIGDGVTTSFNFNHNLNDDMVSVVIKEVATNELYRTEVIFTDSDNIQVNFNTAPTTGQYKIKIRA